MRLVIDIETNSLTNPTKIWCVVCKDLDTGEYHVFRNLTENEEDKTAFVSLLAQCSLVVGHNLLAYDSPTLLSLTQIQLAVDKTCDTLIVSKLANYSREDGHSIESYGREFGLKKIDFKNFSEYSKELEEYCVRDVDICARIYNLYRNYIDDYYDAVRLEQQFQLIVNELHQNGFAFDKEKAEGLLSKVKEELNDLDAAILKQFPPKIKLIREISPKLTKYGTLHRGDFRWVSSGDLSEFNGGPFCRCGWHPFNPSSHKQIVDVLNAAGWQPVDKTETHKDLERSFTRQKFNPRRTAEETSRLEDDKVRLTYLKQYGWKINENNLSTLPPSAPTPARTLAKRILYESRRRTLTEWLGLVTPLERIHGEFHGIGAWTHRMSHQKPNMANIPNSHKEDGSIKLLGRELRSCWIAPKKKRLLVGVDAEGIQLRIFAHYVNDSQLTQSLIDGRKADKTDPHSLNQRVLGRICKSRQSAKRFLYALLLGGGVNKFSQILECREEEAKAAVDLFNQRYPGFDYLKREQFPIDAKRGFFTGLDGRRVPIPGDTVGERRHLAMSGYLQNGEAIIIKKAAVLFNEELKKYNSFLVDIVHDEYQIEVPNDIRLALQVAQLVAESISLVGEELKLNCPMAGSYYNDDKKAYTIGTNWYTTH